jgi:addiction module RelE/StbE family toxin
MLRLKWAFKALIDFDKAQAYIAQKNPMAAQGVARRIHEAAQLLRENPNIGTPAQIKEARTWNVHRTPYLIVYRVRDDTLEIVRLWHGRRDWQNVKH